jgi:hypothetical protein
MEEVIRKAARPHDGRPGSLGALIHAAVRRAIEVAVVKRPVADRLRLLREALRNVNGPWVLSGSLDGWGDSLIPLFELVVFLLVPTNVVWSVCWNANIHGTAEKLSRLAAGCSTSTMPSWTGQVPMMRAPRRDVVGHATRRGLLGCRAQFFDSKVCCR